MRKVAAAALVFAGLTSAGCYDIEQTLTLQRNLSGQAGFTMKVNMEPMVLFALKLQREMAGQTGDPTPAEIEKAKKEMLANKPVSSTDFEKDKKELAAKLPKGVTLVDATFKDEGLNMIAGFTFGFDHPSKLAQIKFPKDQNAPPSPSPVPTDNPIDSPFGGLQVVDEGATILVTSPAQNPMGDQTNAPVPDAEMKKMMEGMMKDMFKDLRVAFKITAPFTIVEHNAHRKEGNTLIWEYTIKSLTELKPDQLNQSIRVRYRK
jgi:hypothetical protein